ncbi:MAG: PEP-CTERM sorting domain-containing protein, partial [Planctomycetaceae bacterium]
TTNMARKLALASGAAALAVAGSNNAQAGIVAAQGTPIRPPVAGHSRNNWDVDGDGTSEFRLWHNQTVTLTLTASGLSTIATTSFGFLTEMFAQCQCGFGRVLITPSNRLAKLANGSAVGTAGRFVGNSSSQLSHALTMSGFIQAFAGDWSMGQTGFFGFAFNKSGQRHYGWGELQFDPTSANTNGYGFQITRAYYNDTPGASIAAGDTGGGGAVPEPSTFALGLLAAGGVAAYRSRRKQPAA